MNQYKTTFILGTKTLKGVTYYTAWPRTPLDAPMEWVQQASANFKQRFDDMFGIATWPECRDDMEQRAWVYNAELYFREEHDRTLYLMYFADIE